MLTQQFAQEFARDWIESWNSHNLERILSHYTDDFEMSSPLIASVANEPSGVLKGKEAVGNYWAKALQRIPDLKFELENVFVGAISVVITYKNISRGVRVAEIFFFNKDSKVYRASGNYSE